MDVITQWAQKFALRLETLAPAIAFNGSTYKRKRQKGNGSREPNVNSINQLKQCVSDKQSKEDMRYKNQWKSTFGEGSYFSFANS